MLLVDSSGRSVGDALQAQWPWVRVLSFEHRMLPGRARNLAAGIATGELLAFIDADAIPAPDWLQQLEQGLDAGVDMVAGAILNGTPEAAWGTVAYLLEFLEWPPERRTPLLHAASCNLLVRRAAFDRAGGFPEDIWPGEDTVFTARFANVGSLVFAPSARVTHLNRVGVRHVLAHQRRLGASWVNVGQLIAIRGSWLAARHFAPLGVLARMYRLPGQLRRAPSARSGVTRSLPLLPIGLVAWGSGIVYRPAEVTPRSGRAGGRAAADGRTLRLGLVGCGTVVERGYVPALKSVAGVEVTAVAEPDAARRRIVPGAAGYDSVEEMLAESALDAVLVCSPPELHVAHARACAEARVPILVEKPPGLTREDALELASLTPMPMIGFNRRFARGLEGRRLRIAGATRITALFDAPPRDWNPTRPAPDPLLDLGCHLIDLAVWVTGSAPVRARAVRAPAGRAAFELELAGGARLYGECGAGSSYRELLEIRDTAGRGAAWHWPEPTIRTLIASRVGRPSGLIDSWARQIGAFARAARRGDPGSLATAADAVPVMAAMDAVRASDGQDGRWISVR